MLNTEVIEFSERAIFDKKGISIFNSQSNNTIRLKIVRIINEAKMTFNIFI